MTIDNCREISSFDFFFVWIVYILELVIILPHVVLINWEWFLFVCRQFLLGGHLALEFVLETFISFFPFLVKVQRLICDLSKKIKIIEYFWAFKTRANAPTPKLWICIWQYPFAIIDHFSLEMAVIAMSYERSISCCAK